MSERTKPSNWRTSTLGNVATWVSGGTPSKLNPKYWGREIPWASAKDMKSLRIYETEDYVTKEAIKDGLKVVPKGSILMLVRGMTLHNDLPICVVMQDTTFNQDVKGILPKEGIDETFLVYCLLANKPRLRALVDSASHGTGRIHSEILKRVEVPIPPLETQRAIAHILGTLDDKIELNRSTNETLEAMAKAIFKSWFVDFDPVKAKAEGRQPEGIDAETAALFPDGFENSELGEIPRGWKTGILSDIVSLSRAALNPQLFTEEAFEHFSIPAFDNEQKATLEKGTAIRSNKFLVPDGCILVSKLNPETPRVWLPTPNPNFRSVTSTEFLVFIPLNPTIRAFTYGFVTSPLFTETLALRVTGTSKSHQRVKPDDVLRLPVILPPSKLQNTLASLVNPLLDQVASNRLESRDLATLRDSLLPKLLSGELSVA
jgi:type I restriction enzyme, S subunit